MPREITAEMFEEATGRKPIDDDLERVNCDKAGKVGHYQCGWCELCGRPRYECLHGVKGASDGS